MSTTPPPDRPTERLTPTPTPTPVYEERVVTPAGDPIGSLRTGLMVVGVIAVAALGVAIYALMKDDDSNGSRNGVASDARVSQLDDRIDRISRQVQGLRSGGGAASSDAVEDRVAALEKTVESLAERPSADPQQAIDQLSGRIDDIARDVEALQQGQPAP